MLLVLAAGCGGADEPDTSTEPLLAGTALTLGVVDDPGMQAEIARLAGEWNARTGSTLEVVPVELGDQPPAVDVLIYPPARLGMLAERDWLAELPQRYLERGDLAWEQFWEPLRRGEVVWGEKRKLAVPLGSPVAVLVYRRDLFEAAKIPPPETWADYQRLAARFAAADANTGSSEPLAEGWAGVTLLVRAAAYCRHRGHFSDLFDVDRMNPLIDGPPFVRALEELVAAAKAATGQLEQDPAGVVRSLASGRAALGIAWLETAPPDEELTLADGVELGIAPLPGSAEVYNHSSGDWEERQESRPVPLLGIGGRQGSVLKQSKHPAAAWELLAAVCGREWGPRVSQASRSTAAPAKGSRATSAPRRNDAYERWMPGWSRDAAAGDFEQTLRASMSSTRWMYCLRIPGRQQYLAALDSAVRAAIRDEATPQQALTRTAVRWREITEQLGRDAQRRAYQRSQGMIP